MVLHQKARHVLWFDQALQSTLIIVAIILFIICLSFVVIGLIDLVHGWGMILGLVEGDVGSTTTIISGLGSVVIGIAVLDLTKSILDEEINTQKTKNVQERARDFLTRFLPVIIFAISAEIFVKMAHAGSTGVTGLFFDIAMIGIAVGAMLGGLAMYMKMTSPCKETVAQN
jgi:hypothetical protein